MAKDLAIVLNDGGLTSAVATALAAQRHRVVMVYVQANDDRVDRAKASFEQQVAHFKPFKQHVLAMPFLGGFKAADAAGLPLGIDPRTPVPVAPRLLDLMPIVAIGLRLAAHHAAASLHLGLRLGAGTDALAAATEYGQIWNELVQVPCGLAELTVETPLLDLELWQAVDLGVQSSAPLDRTWTCEAGGPEACWACRKCRAREAAFVQAAKPDPLRAARKAA